MSFFDVLKSYEHEINEVRRYLISERKMRKEYANPFVAAYGKKLGKLIVDGHKKSLQLNTSDARGAQLNKELADHGVRFAVLGQATRAYFSDLRAGRYVNTAVEVAIWGILLDEDPELVDTMKPGFWEFIFDNFEKMVPNADDVFDYDDEGVKAADSFIRKQKISGAKESDVQVKVATNKASEKPYELSDGEAHKTYIVLISMLGKTRANLVLNRLWMNSLVRTAIGLKMTPERLDARILLGLRWLTEAVKSSGFNGGVLQSLRSANANFFTAAFGIRDFVMTNEQVADLIEDVKNYRNQGDCYFTGPKGRYLDGLDETGKHLEGLDKFYLSKQ